MDLTQGIRTANLTLLAKEGTNEPTQPTSRHTRRCSIVAMLQLQLKSGRLKAAFSLLPSYCHELLYILPLVFFLQGGNVYATPFLPGSDGQILEQLRSRPADPVARELRELRTRLSREPNNMPLALQLARRYIEQGRAEGDPRYYGYAEATLQPWWNLAEPPTQILLLRATLAQSRHDFSSALNDLTRVLQAEPRNAQAWLTGAAILQVQADYPQAKRSCMALLRLATPLVTTTCLAGVASLTGQAGQAYQQLRDALAHTPSSSADEQLWVLTVLAEIAARTGQAAAEDHYKEAVKLGLRDNYLLGAYADFLLDQGRPAEVLQLLKDQTRADNLLLRLTLAEEALNASGFAAHKQALQARFDASGLRGDSRHRREEARFTLHLLKQPTAALVLAQQNWTVQREPADARILLEAALATHNEAAAQPVLQWLDTNRVEDTHLQRLRAQLSNPPAKP